MKNLIARAFFLTVFSVALFFAYWVGYLVGILQGEEEEEGEGE